MRSQERRMCSVCFCFLSSKMTNRPNPRARHADLARFDWSWSVATSTFTLLLLFSLSPSLSLLPLLSLSLLLSPPLARVNADKISTHESATLMDFVAGSRATIDQISLLGVDLFVERASSSFECPTGISSRECRLRSKQKRNRSWKNKQPTGGLSL